MAPETAPAPMEAMTPPAPPEAPVLTPEIQKINQSWSAGFGIVESRRVNLPSTYDDVLKLPQFALPDSALSEEVDTLDRRAHALADVNGDVTSALDTIKEATQARRENKYDARTGDFPDPKDPNKSKNTNGAIRGLLQGLQRAHQAEPANNQITETLTSLRELTVVQTTDGREYSYEMWQKQLQHDVVSKMGTDAWNKLSNEEKAQKILAADTGNYRLRTPGQTPPAEQPAQKTPEELKAEALQTEVKHVQDALRGLARWALFTGRTDWIDLAGAGMSQADISIRAVLSRDTLQRFLSDPKNKDFYAEMDEYLKPLKLNVESLRGTDGSGGSLAKLKEDGELGVSRKNAKATLREQLRSTVDNSKTLDEIETMFDDGTFTVNTVGESRWLIAELEREYEALPKGHKPKESDVQLIAKGREVFAPGKNAERGKVFVDRFNKVLKFGAKNQKAMAKLHFAMTGIDTPITEKMYQEALAATTDKPDVQVDTANKVRETLNRERSTLDNNIEQSPWVTRIKKAQGFLMIALMAGGLLAATGINEGVGTPQKRTA